MALKYIRCTRCGGDLTQKGEAYICQYCNAGFLEDFISQNEKIIAQFLDELKLEKVSALRQQLYEKTHAKYLSRNEILETAKGIRSYLPEDFLARFYESACSKNKQDVIDFIQSIDYEYNYANLDLVIEFMIKNLNSENLLAVSNLIENAYKENCIELYSKFTNAYEKEAEKIDKGIYERIIPRDVFIAYSSKDMKVVEEITQYLESQGITCFVAIRNLRHGVGAVEDYDKALEEAIDNCKIFLFVSSKNSRNMACDALKKEIIYVKRIDLKDAPIQYKNNYIKLPKKYKKPRIQLRLDNEETRIADRIVNEFFDGYEWCYDKEAIIDRISDIMFNFDTDTEEQEEKKKLEDDLKKQNEELKRKLEELEQKQEGIKISQEISKIKENNNYKFKKGDIIQFGSYPQTKEGDTFKVEPIKWKVLDVQNGEALLLSEKILDAHKFDKESNNYANSEIRRWLNEEFYNKAFNEEEKSKIITTNVDNSERSTNLNNEPNKWNYGKNEYACENTNDKIFLLSQQEVTKKEYGFNIEIYASDSSRKKQGTEYAKSHGLYVDSSSGNSWWWLRSPYYVDSSYARCVNRYGDARYSNYVIIDDSGVVPALRIKLS